MLVNDSEQPDTSLSVSHKYSRQRLLTVIEAGERLGLKPATIRFWIWTRKIEYVKLGARAVRISENVIQALITRGAVPPRS